jgi:hypothetical protein
VGESGHIFDTVPLFAPVFDALNRSGTRYVVVGGVAAILHGYVRGTTDVDVVEAIRRDATAEGKSG